MPRWNPGRKPCSMLACAARNSARRCVKSGARQSPPRSARTKKIPRPEPRDSLDRLSCRYGRQPSKPSLTTKFVLEATLNVLDAAVGGLAPGAADRLTPLATVMNDCVVANDTAPPFSACVPPSTVPPHDPAISDTSVVLSATT